MKEGEKDASIWNYSIAEEYVHRNLKKSLIAEFLSAIDVQNEMLSLARFKKQSFDWTVIGIEPETRSEAWIVFPPSLSAQNRTVFTQESNRKTFLSPNENLSTRYGLQIKSSMLIDGSYFFILESKTETILRKAVRAHFKNLKWRSGRIQAFLCDRTIPTYQTVLLSLDVIAKVRIERSAKTLLSS